jgi:hypothetical protein
MRVLLTSRRGRAAKVAAIALAALMSTHLSAQTPAADLAQLQFDIVGVRLVVDPPVLTVPKNIATQINTSLVLPPGIGAEARDALLQLTDGAVVEAELRGPSIPATRITAVPGQPIPLPPFALPGDYVLDGSGSPETGRRFSTPPQRTGGWRRPFRSASSARSSSPASRHVRCRSTKSRARASSSTRTTSRR